MKKQSMSNCSQHKKEVAGISDMNVLAEKIADLHYESLAELMEKLHDKLWKDAQNDISAGRIELGNKLLDASFCMNEAHFYIYDAWQISKPFMETNPQIENKQ